MTQRSRLAALYRAVQAETQRLSQEFAGAWSRTLRKHGATPFDQIYLFEKLERRTLLSLPPGVTASAGAVYTYNPPTHTLSLTSGTLTFSQDVGSASSLTLDLSADGSGSSLIFDSTEHINSLTLTNAATATLSVSGSYSVSGGSITSYGTSLAEANTQVLVLNGLSIPVTGASLPGGGTNSAQGTLDLTNNAMILNYTGPSATALAAADALMKSGSDDAVWDGTGITSSEAEADDNSNGYTGIGAVDNGDIGDSIFSGQDVSSGTQILFMFTYNGDADLNGVMNATDTISYDDGLSSHPGGPVGTGWEYAELDYGATTQGSFGDFQLLESGFHGYEALGKINCPDLPAPSPLTATPASAAQIDLGWTNPSGTSSSVVQLSTDGGATWTTIATPSGGTDTYDATGLSAGDLYYFRVQVLDSSGEASPWATASGYTYYGVQATGTASFAYQNASASFTVGNIQVEGPSPSAGQISALIDWGDDTQSAGTITASGSDFTLTGSHEYYQPGAYAVTAEVVYSPPSVSAVDTFLGSYMEVRSGVDPATLETGDSHSVSGSEDFPLAPVLSVDNSTGSYSLSVVGSATYAFDQTLDEADQDGSDSVQRQEPDGAVDFNFSASGTFTIPPSSPSFAVAGYSLSSAGSASLTMIDDQRAVNDSLDQTLAAEYDYTHTKTYTGSTGAYTWNYNESADLAVSGSGKLYEDRFGLGAADGIAREDAQLEAFLDANAGLYGSYTLSGTQSYDDTIAETGNYSSQTWNGTDVTTRNNTLAENGSNQSLSYSQDLDGDAEDSVTITGTDNSYSLTDDSYSDPAVASRTATDLSSTTTGTGQIDVAVTLHKHGDTSTGAYTLTATDGSADSTLTLTTTDQGQVTNAAPTLVDDYSDTNTGNVESGDFSLTSTMDVAASTDQTVTDSSSSSTDEGSTPYAATLTQTGDLYATETLSLTESTVSGYNTTDTTDQSVSTDVSETPTGDYTLSATVDQSGGTFSATTTLHSYDDADTTQYASSQTMTAYSPSSLTETVSGGGNVLTGSYSGVTDDVTSHSGDTSTTTDQSQTIVDTAGTTDSSNDTDSGNDYNGSYSDTSTDSATSTDQATTTNQSQTVSANSTSTDSSASTNAGDDDTGADNTTSNETDTATASSTATDQSQTVIDHGGSTDISSENDTGNDYTGSYTNTSTDALTSTDQSTTTNQSQTVSANSTTTDSSTSTNTGDDDSGADNTTSNETDTATASSTATDQSQTVIDHSGSTDISSENDTGNDYTGSYTNTSTDALTSTDQSTTTNQSQTVSANSTTTDSSTSTNTGDDDSGADNTTSNETDTATASSTATDQSQTVIDHGGSTDISSENDTGNDYTGSYTNTSTDGLTSTDQSTTTNQSLSSNSNSTTTDSSTSTNTGDDDSGADNTTSNGTDTNTASSTATDQSQTIIDHSGSTDISSENDTGNDYTGSYTNTSTDSLTSTDQSTTTNQSLSANSNSTSTDFSTSTNTSDDDTGLDNTTSNETATATATSTTIDQSQTIIDHNGSTEISSENDTGDDDTGSYTDTSTDSLTSTDQSTTTNQSLSANSSSTATDHSTSTNTSDDDTGLDNTTSNETDTATASSTTTDQSQTIIDHGGSTDVSSENDTGNDYTGSYTNTSTDALTSTDQSTTTNQSQTVSANSTTTDSSTSTNTGDDDSGADNTTSNETDTATASSTTTDQSQTIIDHSGSTDISSENDTGNDYTGSYTNTSTDGLTSTDQSTTTDQSQTVSANSTSTDSSTSTNTGDDDSGADNTTSHDTDTDTAGSTATDQSQTVTDNSTVTDHASSTNTSNDDTGLDDTTSTDSESGTDATTTTNASESLVDQSSSSDSSTTTDNDNDDTGAYTLHSTEFDSGSDTLSGAAGTRSYTGSDTTGDTVTTIETGDSDTDASTTTIYDNPSSTTTTTDTYSGGSGGYDTQTVTASSNTTLFDFEDPDGATYSLSSLGSMSSNTTETGSDASSYTLTGASSSDFSDSETGDDDTGNYTLTTSSTDGSTYTRTGADFSILQSDNDSGTVTTTGNDITGDYTATAIGNDTVATSQTDSGTDAETVSQTSTNSSTLTNTGNDYTGDFTTTGTESLNTTLDQSYTYSDYDLDTTDTYSLHETSSDAPGITITGNDIDGTQQSTQTGDETYSVSQFDTGVSYSLNETGDKSYTLTAGEDANTGDSTSTETGTDSYTLTESGTGGIGGGGSDTIGIGTNFALSYTISVTGSEDYGITISANSQSGDFSQSYTGGGEYSASGVSTWSDALTDSTYTVPYSDSGDTSYADAQFGDTRDGDVTLSQTGTDRYQLLPAFDNPSNGGQETSGVVDYSPVGLPAMVTRASVPAGIFSSIGDDRYNYCFAAGTLVLMADGSRKAIEKIEAGEMVLAVPDTDQEAEPRACRVMEVYHNAPAKLLAVRVAEHGDVSGGGTIFATAEHPFYVVGRGWTRAAELREGHKLRTADGGRARIGAAREAGRVEAVFNLRVEGARTYFVADGEAGPAVLVHNVSYAWTTDPDNANSHIGTVPNRHEGVIVYNNPDVSQRMRTYKFSDDQEKDIILTALRNGDTKQELAKFLVQVREVGDAVADTNPIVGARTVLTGQHASDNPASGSDRALVAVGLLAGPAMKVAGSVGEVGALADRATVTAAEDADKAAIQGERAVASDAERSAGQVVPPGCFRASTLVLTNAGKREIAKICLGQRVLTARPGSESFGAARNSGDYRVVRLRYTEPESGNAMELAYLRRAALAEGLAPGDTVKLSILELDVEGSARVTSIEPAPPIEAGEGRLVTGTIRNTNFDLRSLRLQQLDEPIHVTATHPVYSEDRLRFVTVSSLARGERVRTRQVTAVVESTRGEHGSFEVFNLEVEGAHRYYVSDAEVLAHNAGGVTSAAGQFRGPNYETVNWDHIYNDHADWGNVARQGGSNNTFFAGLNEQQIQARVKAAWAAREKIATQVDTVNGVTRIKYRGVDPVSKQTIEMWYNTQTKTLETAYPAGGT